MADHKVEGKNWYKEVKKAKDTVPYNERLDFYLKRAAIKADLKSLSGDFENTISGQIKDGNFKSYDNLRNLEKFEKNINSGDTIYKILLEYFSKICSPDQAIKETYLSLAYLMKTNSGSNVDKLFIGGKVIIQSGKISVFNGSGDTSYKDAYLRPEILQVSPPVEEVPVEEVPVEQPPVEEVPVDEVPVEQPPVEEVPDEEVPVEQPPVEEVPDEEVPVEQPPVEEVPAEEVPVEQPPVEEVPVEQPPVEEIPKPVPTPTPVEPESNEKKEKILASSNEGDFKFDVIKFMETQVNNKYGDTLYHFIKGTLQTKGFITGSMPEKDKLAYIDAIINICRLANPKLNLDDFSSINGKKIKFPSKIIVSPEFKDVAKNYKRLQELAEQDGYQISVQEERNKIYAEALRTGKPVPESQYFFRKSEGIADSPAVLQEEALEQFTAIAKEFNERTGGWQISYSDVLRTEELQNIRNPRVSDTTHYTGRTLDITDGRFKKPDGTEITYSGNREFIPKIENEFRPLIVELINKHNGVAFVEAGHWHVYFPKTHVLDLENTQDTVVIKAPQPESPPVSTDPLPLGNLDFLKNPEKLSSKEVDRRMKAFKEKYGEFADMTPMQIIFNFGPVSAALQAKYKNYSYERLQKEIDTLSQDKIHRGNNQLKINELVKMRNFLVYKDMLSIVIRMAPAEVKRYTVLKLSALHLYGEAGDEVRFDDLVSVWNYKEKRKGSSSIFKQRYPALKKSIKALDHSVTVEKWHEKQIKATAYFNKHAEELGIKSEMSRYVDAGVYLGVINAEFFNELDGETFLTLAPVLFESYNIMHGPAVNDEYFSAGSVQLIGETFQNLQSSYGKQITAVQAKDKSYQVIVPNVKNNDEYAKAMLVDFDSNLFYAQLAIYDHIELASNTLMKDPNFKKAWDKASEDERQTFVAGLAPAAINSGRSGASSKATKLLGQINSTKLSDYTDRLPDAFGGFAGRGAACAAKTAEAYQRMSD